MSTDRNGTGGSAPAQPWRAQKLTRDIGWSLGSFAVLALSGIVINLVIAGTRNAAALGVFNQAYAVYIVASQVATLGLHYSVLRYSALHENDESVRARMLSTAVLLACALGFAAAFVVGAAAAPIGDALDSLDAGRAVAFAAPGLLLFPLNKVLLAYLNGLRRMRAYALLQALRYVTIMVFVTIVAVSDWPIYTATLGFLTAETATAVAALAYVRRSGLALRLGLDRAWVSTHLSFGSRSLMAGLFAEFNSRIDVLMIGIFLPDREVGIYSFAAMMVDGMYHVLAMVRLNFNPVLVAAVRDGDHETARRLRSQSGRFGVPITACMALGALATLWLLSEVVMPGKHLGEGLMPLAVLASGLVLVSFLIPFDNLLLVTGHPGYQTLQQMTTVGVNVLACLALIPAFGIIGAASATAASYVAGSVALLVLGRRIVGWNLLTNRFRS